MRMLKWARNGAWLVLMTAVSASFFGCPMGGQSEFTPVGRWRITFDWQCDNLQKANTTFRVFANGQFTDTFGSGANGTWEAAQNQVTFYYNNGTVYAGVLGSATSMSGTMERYDDLPGCWQATLTSEDP